MRRDATGVARLDRGGGVGIERDELGVGVVRARQDPVAHGPVFGGERERVDHRLHIEPGPAHEQRALAARLDVGDRGPGLLLETRHRPLLTRIGDVDQVVRYQGALGDARLGGADVEAPVHLHGVDRHELDVAERACHLERERRLPGGGGADDREVWALQDGGVTGPSGAALTGMRMRAGRGAGANVSRSPCNQCGPRG